MQDEEIVKLYLERDEAAIKETSDKYGGKLRRLSFDIVKDDMSAEECENETYLQTWNSIPPNEPYSYFFAYLARITRHISLNLCRQRDAIKRKAHVEELSLELEQCIPASGNTESIAEGKELAEVISAFLKRQDEEKRNIFIRRYWYLDSVADISKRYFITHSKVKTTLFRMRNDLRVFLEKEGYVL